MRSPYLFLLFLFVILAKSDDDDAVKFLPGIGVPKTRTLSGYSCINETAAAYLFYFFVESQSDPKNVRRTAEIL
jgi:hypothetical protein